MRISLKWLLIVVTYLAVAAAACVQPGAGWRVALWVGNLFLLLYAVLAVVYYRGRTQATALGFALFMVAATMAMMRFSSLSPIADAVGPFVPWTVVTAEELEEATERVQRLGWELTIASTASSPEYRARIEKEYSVAKQRLNNLTPLESLAGAIESLCVMAAGLVGCVVARHVWAAAQREK